MEEAKYRAAIAATLAAMLLSSCAVGPDFMQPAAPGVEGYTREHLAARTSSTDTKFGQSQRFVFGEEIPAQWWQVFHSPAINALVKKALDANPNLQATMASLRAAKELVYAQQGKYFPFIQGNFAPSRQQIASELGSPLTSGATLFNLYTAQVLVSYTFDTWGLNRRTVESQQALADFQGFQVEAAYLTLISNVVSAAIQEAALRGQIDATQGLININTKMLGTMRHQLQTGYENRIDVAAQEAQLAQISATLPPLRKALALQRDLIAALTGRFPSQEPTETFRLADLRLPTNLPVSLPAQLIEQRPDVRSAQEQLHSASALVGVATANMLPSLTVSANSGYTSASLASLFTGPTLFWTVAGSVTQPLFDGFTLLHTERAAQGAYQAAAWGYRTTVVGALQNVADSMRAIQNDADALKAAHEFEKAAKISLDLSQQQMQTGQANILFLLNAQITYQNARLQVVTAQAARLSDAVALYAALGGGWQHRDGPPAPEQVFDVANGTARPVGTEGGPPPATTVPAVLSSKADASSQQPGADTAKLQSVPPAAERPGVWPPPQPFGVAANQASDAPGTEVREGSKQ